MKKGRPRKNSQKWEIEKKLSEVFSLKKMCGVISRNKWVAWLAATKAKALKWFVSSVKLRNYAKFSSRTDLKKGFDFSKGEVAAT